MTQALASGHRPHARQYAASAVAAVLRASSVPLGTVATFSGVGRARLSRIGPMSFLRHHLTECRSRAASNAAAINQYAGRSRM